MEKERLEGGVCKIIISAVIRGERKIGGTRPLFLVFASTFFFFYTPSFDFIDISPLYLE